MKKSLINTYLNALSIIVNDNRITFSIIGNFDDKCHIVAYWCNCKVLHDFELFNDSSTVDYDNLVNDYFALMTKHPTMRDSQLFSLRYDNRGYCTLAVTDESNLELFGTRHKRISKSLAKYLYNNVAFDDNYYISDYCDKYIATYDFNQTVLFSL